MVNLSLLSTAWEMKALGGIQLRHITGMVWKRAKNPGLVRFWSMAKSAMSSVRRGKDGFFL